jgi:hypothetical protein
MQFLKVSVSPSPTGEWNVHIALSVATPSGVRNVLKPVGSFSSLRQAVVRARETGFTLGVQTEIIRS